MRRNMRMHRARILALGATLFLSLLVAGASVAAPGGNGRWSQSGAGRSGGRSSGWQFQGAPGRGAGYSSGWSFRGGSGRSGGSPSSGWSYGGTGRGAGGSSGWSRYPGGYPQHRSYYPRTGYYPRSGYYYPRYHYWPRSYFSLGIGVGSPYYYYDSPVVVHRVRHIVIEDVPPAGCYYYDPYCDERFSCLDDYVDHLSDVDHEPILEVIDGEGSCVNTYGYAGGRWSLVN